MKRVMRILRCDRRAVAMIEFAMILPVFLLMALGAAELANYMTVRMRVSQLALHLADHSARIGTGSVLAEKTISDAMINDILTGANLQAAELNLYQRGRVVISSLERQAGTSPQLYKIGWQRCRGLQHHTPLYGSEGQTNMAGMGPTGAQVFAMENNSTIFVEVNYDYRPLIGERYVSFGDIVETAAMAVRDRRKMGEPDNAENVSKARCDQFTG